MTGPMERALKLFSSGVGKIFITSWNDRPMERALKPKSSGCVSKSHFCWNDRPDGEGIETSLFIQYSICGRLCWNDCPMERALKQKKRLKL